MTVLEDLFFLVFYHIFTSRLCWKAHQPAYIPITLLLPDLCGSS